jgi:hypothetical protein
VIPLAVLKKVPADLIFWILKYNSILVSGKIVALQTGYLGG